jgi:exopolysaccharide production protein ExoQ
MASGSATARHDILIVSGLQVNPVLEPLTNTMPPTLALCLWLIFTLGLLAYDPARESRTSLALWVPLIWMFIVGSRLPSQWLGQQLQTVSQALEEGNALDRAILTTLILLAIGILALRPLNWSGFFTRNFILMAFLLFALMSILWSDFPFISFKRWIRDFGNYLVILVVLSDTRPLEAIRTVLRRLCYLLIPLSILVIKYFPQIGKTYEPWSGASLWVGAATSKNMLGVACLVSGIFFFWDTMARWPERRDHCTKRIIVVNVLFMGMTLWLLNLSNSATSRVCLLIGCLIITAVQSKVGKRRPTFIKLLIPACYIFYLTLAYVFDLSGRLAGAVGRDPTLTDRTLLWQTLLSMHTNPLVGTGYESFWLGPRLQWIWRRFYLINEAHNGFLEVYLSLGAIGCFLLGGFLIASYRTICKRLKGSSSLASLSLALWAVLLFYNVTEAAFKASHLMWLTFLLGAIAVPKRAVDPVRSMVAPGAGRVSARFSRIPLEAGSLRR